MSTSSKHTSIPIQVFCNSIPESYSKKRKCKKISLEYRPGQQSKQNVKFPLNEFIESIYYLPDRILDLLEIATYIFSGDRSVHRGNREAVEYHAWSRSFEYFISVREPDFWNREDVKYNLSQAIEWMTGDKSYSFNFISGHDTGKAHLFDNECHSMEGKGNPRILLFSGGLDSLSGLIELLETTDDPIWPISHDSGNPSPRKTQKKLIEAIDNLYPGRVNHRIFTCHLHDVRAPEESQRTRAFLYCSMALGMAVALKQKNFYIFENGVTALNFPKRAGMINARASRTAHPKTLTLLKNTFALILDDNFEIKKPYAFKTKTDVINILKDYNRTDLMNSSVSCSKTFKPLGIATHCGECSQCIDRRFAAYASQTNKDDEGGIYAFDFINEPIVEGETKTGITDYLRQAHSFLIFNLNQFYYEMIDQLADAIDINSDQGDQVEKMYSLCHRHGHNVQTAAHNMIKPLVKYPAGSLHTIVYNTDFSRPPVFPLANQIASEFCKFLYHACSKVQPENENDLNAKLDGYLTGHKEKFQREHPFLSFATARTVPDLSNAHLDLLIEAKYIRGSTSPSVATSGIAEDLTKYPDETLKLFVVYDPYNGITDPEVFKSDFEKKRYCIIEII